MDLQDLYKDLIIDHNKSPRNFRRLQPSTHSSEGFNPLCGDKLHVYVTVQNDLIEDVTFEGAGCAISIASASLMTEHLKGKPLAHARALFSDMHALLTDNNPPDIASLGKLGALAGVRQYPTRVKCATLCWHTLISALDGNPQGASTE